MKYKLKKIYPNGPKLGTIINRRVIGEDYWAYDNSRVVLFAKDHPENYPEIWEKVVEKDYEILSLVASERNPQHKKGSKFLHNKDYKFKNMHPTEFWDIYSVKRISDNKIFTIGDLYEDLIIEKMFMSVDGNILTTYRPKDKQSLFTTEDGVDIFEGDTFYYVKFKQYNNTLGKPFEIVKGNHPTFKYEPQYEKYFSTKEKAEEYILLNKPCLSYGEVQEYLKVKDCNKVLDLAQSKIQQSV